MLIQRETTREVAKELLSYARINEDDTILEPSAGTGNVANIIKEQYPNNKLHCVELNKAKRDSLKEQGHKVVGSDYLRFTPEKLYDSIIALPNFRDNVDCDHVRRMYDHLKQGGRLISLMSPEWKTGDSLRQFVFRNWLKGKKYQIKTLKNNPFKENGETVPCIILILDKYEAI